MRASRQQHAKGRRAKEKASDNSKELQQFYKKVYGDRWTALQQALLLPVSHVALANAFAPGAQGACLAAGLNKLLGWRQCQVFSRLQPSGPYQPPGTDPVCGLRSYYWLDLASLLPVMLLQLKPGMAVLDMCAAPGGKTLLIAQQLFAHQLAGPDEGSQPAPLPPGPTAPGSAAHDGCSGLGEGAASEPLPACGTALPPGSAPAAATASPSSSLSGSAAAAAVQPGPGRLVCNEPDRARHGRLHQVVDEYLPVEARARVEVLNQHGAFWVRNQADAYDCVLVDAPCSSDRHVLQAAAGQRGVVPASDWSLGGCKGIADTQLQLCCAALRALKVGGRLVYSTCSIAPMQNGGVVARLVQRFGDCVKVLQPLEVLRQECSDAAAALQPEAVEGGAICLPDRSGHGPIFAAVLEKVKCMVGGSAASMLLQVPSGSGSDDAGSEGGDVGDGGV